MLPHAKIQEAALAEGLRCSSDFVSWFLSHTKYAGLSVTPVLVRSDNPWYTSPKTGRQSETDVLAVFQVEETGRRVALHIENKRRGDRFRPGQPETYRERATDWMHVEKWGGYSDFQCVLIAERAFIEKYATSCTAFDVVLAADAVAAWLPEFGDGVSSTKT